MKCRVGRLQFALSERGDPGAQLVKACHDDLNERGRCVAQGALAQAVQEHREWSAPSPRTARVFSECSTGP